MRVPVRDLRGADRIVVYKFGSSVLGDSGGFRAAALEVRSAVEEGARVVAVVSAVAGATDALLSTVGALSAEPPERLVSRLLATGETASVALLAIAVEALGVPAAALAPEALGLRTVGPLLDAVPHGVNPAALTAALARAPVVVVPGFVGLDASGEPSLLGRGGSDWTALFLARCLGAGACTLVKDVDGIYGADPNVVPEAARLHQASWDEVESIGGDVVQPRALSWARKHGLSFRVAALGGQGTMVGPPATLVTEVGP